VAHLHQFCKKTNYALFEFINWFVLWDGAKVTLQSNGAKFQPPHFFFVRNSGEQKNRVGERTALKRENRQGQGDGRWHREAWRDSLCAALIAIGFPQSFSTQIYEDHQGTIKIIHTHCLTDTIHHYAVKISWLNDPFLNHHLHVAFTKSAMQLAIYSTKPINGFQLFQTTSYAIGKCNYPLLHHHYTFLDLAQYSYLQRQARPVNILYNSSIQPPPPL
jgi:hypothetical protein